MRKQQNIELPPHYKKLFIRNFRGFKKADNIRLAPLTFLVGPNSSGKSSLFDALLLLTQSEFSPTIPNTVPNWDGPLIDLGSYTDSVFSHNTKLSIEIGIDVTPELVSNRLRFDLDRTMRIRFKITAPSNEPIGRLSQITVSDVLTNEKIKLQYQPNKIKVYFLGIQSEISQTKFRDFHNWLNNQIEQILNKETEKLKGVKTAWRRIQQFVTTYGLWTTPIHESQRVSSGRAAPQRWYPLTDIRFRQRGYFIGPVIFDAVDPSMLEEGEDYFYSPFRKRKPKIKETMNSILQKLDISSQIKSSKLSPYHSTIELKDSITGVLSKLIDVGYGASQVIPILKACLSRVEGPLFVEQPEIHLHPKAQGVISELLCLTSLHRQVIVETHSVHMINRARILIAQGKLRAEDVIVNYVERTPNGSRVRMIPILENGDFGNEWPEGFFDERYEDTMLLLKLKSKMEKRNGNSS